MKADYKEGSGVLTAWLPIPGLECAGYRRCGDLLQVSAKGDTLQAFTTACNVLGITCGHSVGVGDRREGFILEWEGRVAVNLFGFAEEYHVLDRQNLANCRNCAAPRRAGQLCEYCGSD